MSKAEMRSGMAWEARVLAAEAFNRLLLLPAIHNLKYIYVTWCLGRNDICAVTLASKVIFIIVYVS